MTTSGDYVRAVQQVLDPYLRDGLAGGRTLPPTAAVVLDELRKRRMVVVTYEQIIAVLRPVYGFAQAHRTAMLLTGMDALHEGTNRG